MNIQRVNMTGLGVLAWNHGGQPVHTFAKPRPLEHKTGHAGRREDCALSAHRADAIMQEKSSEPARRKNPGRIS